MLFTEVSIESLMINPFAMLNDEWALLSAGSPEKHNAMTISWGYMGVMWAKPVFTVVVRPQRYTKEFVDAQDMFAVSFYPAEYRKALEILGSKSGRSCDKISESALTPLHAGGTVAFEEAHTIFVCRKLHGGQQLNPEYFVDSSVDQAMYPDKDYHFYYTGAIVKVLQKK